MALIWGKNLDEKTLKSLDLQYVYEEKPGITRQKRGRGFCFIDAKGQCIGCNEEKTRLKALAVPPSYSDVWYCALPNGHLQATGFDTTAKKQYFYHPAWAQLREKTKFSNMEHFAQNLPAFRRKISYILNHPDEFSHKEQLLSAMFRILDNTGMRIGNMKATKTNKTFGLTTLRKKHIDLDSNEVHFEFKGKGGRDLDYVMKDKAVAQIIRDCVDIPGQRFFEYLDEEGEKHAISSGTINAYIKKHMGEDFSAKDFRTWRFSCYFLTEALNGTKQEKPPSLKSLLDNVSALSGNTPSILKSSYIHPGLLEHTKAGSLVGLINDDEAITGLQKNENRLYNFIRSKEAQNKFSSL